MARRSGSPRLDLSGHWLCRTLILLAYAVASVGLPVGRGHAGAGSGCRCGDGASASGNCCCEKSPSRLTERRAACCESAPRRSCCAASAPASVCQAARTAKSCCSASDPERPPADAARCCAKRSGEPAEQNATSGCCGGGLEQKQHVPGHPTVAGCHCGGEPVAGVFVNADPRLLGPAAHVLDRQAWEFSREPAAAILPDRTLAPETPPPKVPVA
jgi:hypothetical protein